MKGEGKYEIYARDTGEGEGGSGKGGTGEGGLRRGKEKRSGEGLLAGRACKRMGMGSGVGIREWRGKWERERRVGRRKKKWEWAGGVGRRS